eukprot:116103-Alexandrium_andersonii.AAC.1
MASRAMAKRLVFTSLDALRHDVRRWIRASRRTRVLHAPLRPGDVARLALGLPGLGAAWAQH